MDTQCLGIPTDADGMTVFTIQGVTPTVIHDKEKEFAYEAWIVECSLMEEENMTPIIIATGLVKKDVDENGEGEEYPRIKSKFFSWSKVLLDRPILGTQVDVKEWIGKNFKSKPMPVNKYGQEHLRIGRIYRLDHVFRDGDIK